MDHYSKGAVVEVEDDAEPFGQMGLKFGDITTMRVRNGSKVRNLLTFATKKMKEDETRSIVFTGTGHAVTKTVTCAEIMKRQMKHLHQINKAYFRKTEEIWEPKEEGLDKLKVNREVPALAILLSKDSLDKNELGYQAPGSFEAKWTDEARQDKRRKDDKQQARKGRDHPKPGRGSQRRDGQRDAQGSMTGMRKGRDKHKQKREQKEQKRDVKEGQSNVEGQRRSDADRTDRGSEGKVEDRKMDTDP